MKTTLSFATCFLIGNDFVETRRRLGASWWRQTPYRLPYLSRQATYPLIVDTWLNEEKNIFIFYKTSSTLIQITACRLVGASPWTEPITTHWQLNHNEYISVKVESILINETHSKTSSAKFQPFCSGIDVWKKAVVGRPNAMMTSSNGNIFRVTGLLCGEFTGPRWIPRTKASDAELWYYLWSASEQTLE